MSKSKGGSWERDFVRVVQGYGLGAMKVPLSGALADYPDDVVVTVPETELVQGFELRVECKYRKTGTGFKRLYGWLEGSTDLALITDDLVVRRVEHWALDMKAEPRTVQTSARKSASRKVMLDWMGAADVLALRMATPQKGPRSGKLPWLIVMRRTFFPPLKPAIDLTDLDGDENNSSQFDLFG